MTPVPLQHAPLALQIHIVAAVVLVPLTIAQFSRPKRGLHAPLGWAWVILMAVVSISSFWIHKFRIIGPFSPIHLLAILTLVTLVRAIKARRDGNIASHRRQMIILSLAFVLAGLFTLAPGRHLYQVILAG